MSVTSDPFTHPRGLGLISGSAPVVVAELSQVHMPSRETRNVVQAVGRVLVAFTEELERQATWIAAGAPGLGVASVRVSSQESRPRRAPFRTG